MLFDILQLWFRCQVTDVNCRIIELRGQLKAGQVLTIGDQYKHGIYIAEILHGTERKVLRLIKTQ